MHNNKDFEIGTKVFITGFTINPVKDPQVLYKIIEGLLSYDKKHLCDFGNITEHENFLGSLVGDIKVDYIENKLFKGAIGYANMDNGYFTLKIYDSVYPSEVQLDLYINSKVLDIQIILDHLSSPAGPFDGLCIFDYQYSLSYISKRHNILNKNNKNIAAYDLNEPYNQKKHQDSIINNEFYEVKLNELKNPECFFCKNQPSMFKLYDNPRKLILVCDNHLNSQGSVSENKVTSWNNGIINKK